MPRRLTCLLLLVLVSFPSIASAHYLWVAVDPKVGDHGQVNVIFEERPVARDGGYLDPFVKHGKTWIRTLKSDESGDIAMSEMKQDDKRWLAGAAPAAGPRSIESYGKFGVYRYGKIDALLHYYAKNLQVEDHDALHELARAKKLKFDIVPHPHGDNLELKVLWQGEPAADIRVYVYGPKGFRTTSDTNKNGIVNVEAKAPGEYHIRATLILPDETGADDGKEYQQVRHSASLVMQMPVE